MYKRQGGDYTAAIMDDNELWSWGNNENGKLGDGTTENRLTPVKIMDEVVTVSAGYCDTMAIDKNGLLWGWGYQVGDGTDNTRYSPVRVKLKYNLLGIMLDRIW